MSYLANQILTVSDCYGRLTARSRSRVSTIVFNDGKRLDGVAEGRDIGIRTFERAMAWFSANWPEGAEWPADVPRPPASPEPSEDAA